MRNLAITGFSFLICLSPAMAQTDRATLTGTVTDAQGSSVRGAVVTVTSVASGLTYRSVTNSAGVYLINSLPVGDYKETIVESGFHPVQFSSFALQIGETREMNAKLTVAAEDTVIQVSTEEDDLNRVSTEIGGVVQGAQLNELPMNGRSFERLEATVPGAIDAAGSTQDQIRFVGLSQEDNGFHMDGVDASGINHQFEKLDMRLQIPVEAISEFKASSAAYSADQGGSAGGQIEIVTKSGGDRFHGSAWEYLRNDVFDARPWNYKGLPKLRLNNFGANLGGPIVKKKLFFFANWEAYRQVLAAQVTGLVPTPAYRTAVIAKSPALATIINSYINAGTPTNDPNALSFTGAGTNPVQEDAGMVRLDYKLSSRTNIFGRYSTDHFRTTAPNGIEITPTGQLSSLFNTLTAPNAIIDVSHNFTSELFTDFRIGYNRDEFSEGGDQTLPYNVAVTGFGTLTTPPTDDRYDTAYSVVDDTTFVKGNNVFKGGLRVRRIQENKNTPKIPVITATYLNENNFQQNLMDSYAFQGASAMTGQRQTEYGAYFMDTIKLKQNLILTAGLRYDFWSVDHDVLGRGVVVDPATCANILCPAGSAWYFPDRNNLAPRLSVSWSPAVFHNKTVISGGGGIYYGQGQFGHLGAAVGNIPQRFTLAQTTTPGLSFPLDPFLGNAAFSVSPTAQDRNRKDAQISEWTLTVQQQLAKGTSMTASYIGSVGSSLWSNLVANGINPSTGKRPYASYTNSTFTWDRTQGTRAYNAFELGVHRDYRTGLLISANYQLAHSIDDGSVGGAEAISPQNQSCIRCERANSQFDMRHYLTASAIWQLPIGRGHAVLGNAGSFVNALVGGWQMAGIGSVRGGLPLNVTLSRSATALPDQINSNQRPNRVQGVPLYPANRSTKQWLNPAAFAVPANGTWGNAGRNLVRGPGHWQADMALQKTVKLRETLSTSFRVEAFNVFNVAQYGSPVVALTSTGSGNNLQIAPANFGLINSAFSTVPTGSGTPRQLELSLRIDY
ncbi:TonB-dependent receptor [Terriglobus roseus]|uniref:Carboxypeptidase regulatory-like domain-containing protein n=1 Tax=Terriglobus roseus TaxID=392734 RepID=A0A1G7KQJ0_9BACT|nr:TonB-dependent receptor [Terriglobus roseus]SDF39421.1 Carboxypeptidase regulatory-like domain-containing protein [Terriglobus roseus]